MPQSAQGLLFSSLTLSVTLCLYSLLRLIADALFLL